jgi:hypothetical protein
VDTEGVVLKALVSEAEYYDGTVGTWLLPELVRRFPRLKKLWADGTFVEQARAYGLEVEITTRLSAPPPASRLFPGGGSWNAPSPG